MADGVISATVGEAKAHPWLIGGSVLAIVVLVWVMSRGSSTPAAANFSFSSGPSDSQVTAGTNLAIAQAADQTALSGATLTANTQTALASDYYGYLANAGQTAASTTATNDSYALQTTQDNNATALAGLTSTNATNYAINATTSGNAAMVSIAQSDVTAQANAQTYYTNQNSINSATQLSAQKTNDQATLGQTIT